MKNILLIFGGDSPESDVSVISGYQAYQNLDVCKYRIYPLYYIDGELYHIPTFDLKNIQNFKDNEHNKTHIIDKRLCIFKRKKIKYLSDIIDCALVTLHGGGGEGGIMQGYLQQLDIPYTSCSVLSSAVALNKYFSKMIAKGLGAGVLDCIYLTTDTYKNTGVPTVDDKTNGERMIVKPNSMGSSIGITVAEPTNISEAIENALLYDTSVIIESCIKKKEYNCAAFSYMGKLFVSDVEEIAAKGDVFSFEEKYQSENETATICEQTELNDKIKDLTEKLYRGFGLNGVARVDYLYDIESKKLYFNEINTIPGSLAFHLLNKKFTYTEMLDMLIDDAIYTKRHGTVGKKFKSDILSKNNYFCTK